ncbi:1715_t:CDS:2, partial [Funneliformis mosseae]
MTILTSRQPTAVSAPGKVLLAGGYLVLDRKYDGIVIGTSARFYSVIYSGKNDFGEISVHSPQFNDGEWKYRVNESFDDSLSCELQPINPEKRNSFVEIAIKYSLSIILHRINKHKFQEIFAKGLDIYIVGSNDFYSQREQLSKRNLPLTSSSLNSLEPFCKVHCNLKEVHKTGLGSSAALITSLVAALFVHFEIVSNQTDDRGLIHNVAQFCHCLAQGKVGSGFDVSAAVWGSHIYKRFSPSILDDVMNQKVNLSALNNIVDPASNVWDNQATKFSLPPEFTLVLADIDAGSHTPSMVGRVLKWHKENADQ